MGFEEILDEPMPFSKIQIKVAFAFHKDTDDFPDHTLAPHNCLTLLALPTPSVPFPVIAVSLQSLKRCLFIEDMVF
jgi:hypothetical protein